MGLFDMFKKKEPAAPAKPEAIEAEVADDVLVAPVSGKVIAMTAVPDGVFASEMMGKGCAIWPEGEVVYAPISGTVSTTMGHAVGITGDNGIEVLVHVGVDTVEMNGKGFTGHVAANDKVKAGEPILGIDRKAIADAGHPDCVVVIVTNTDDYASVEMAVEAESTVEAGKGVVKVTR
jgi:glucose-specific phosphotransferase system IIA component